MYLRLRMIEIEAPAKAGESDTKRNDPRPSWAQGNICPVLWSWLKNNHPHHHHHHRHHIIVIIPQHSGRRPPNYKLQQEGRQHRRRQSVCRSPWSEASRWRLIWVMPLQRGCKKHYDQRHPDEEWPWQVLHRVLDLLSDEVELVPAIVGEAPVEGEHRNRGSTERPQVVQLVKSWKIRNNANQHY